MEPLRLEKGTDGPAVDAEIRGWGRKVKTQLEPANSGLPRFACNDDQLSLQKGRTTAKITMQMAANPGTSFKNRMVLPFTGSSPRAKAAA